MLKRKEKQNRKRINSCDVKIKDPENSFNLDTEVMGRRWGKMVYLAKFIPQVTTGLSDTVWNRPPGGSGLPCRLLKDNQ